MAENTNKMSLANSHQQMLAARVDWEIHQMIFPHLERQTDFGYPFNTEDGMVESNMRDLMLADVGLHSINRAAAKMPLEYGDAFRYVAFREISTMVKAFLELAERHAQSGCRERHAAATPA